MATLKRAKAAGFTLIELVVVIAITAVLVALLLPAVQQAREAARRGACKNNLRQIGLALHDYHDVYNLFPNAAVWGFYPPGKAASSAVPRNYTWIVMLLPYLEQGPLYNAINFSMPLYDTTGSTQNDSHGSPICAKKLSVLMCPSDSQYPSPPNNISWTNYAGATVFWALAFGVSDPLSGVFTDFQNTGFRDMKDGTSTTIMVGETSTYGFIGGGPWNSGYGRSRSVADSFYHTALCPVSSKSCYPGTATNPQWPDGAGAGWGWKGDAHPYAGDATYLAHAGINSDWYGASSVHPGGAQFLMGDGAVRFINQDIDFRNPFSSYTPVFVYAYPSVWLSLNTRNGQGNREPPIGDF